MMRLMVASAGVNLIVVFSLSCHHLSPLVLPPATVYSVNGGLELIKQKFRRRSTCTIKGNKYYMFLFGTKCGVVSIFAHGICTILLFLTIHLAQNNTMQSCNVSIFSEH
jgi:hypothetical protein